QRKLGHLREARVLYKKFLLVDSTSKLRDEVRAVIEELDSALVDEDLARKGRGEPIAGAADDAAPAAPVVPSPSATALPKPSPPEADQPVLLQQSAGPSTAERDPASRPLYQRGWFWVVVGAVVLTGAGAAIYASTRSGAEVFHGSGT